MFGASRSWLDTAPNFLSFQNSYRVFKKAGLLSLVRMQATLPGLTAPGLLSHRKCLGGQLQTFISCLPGMNNSNS